MTTFNRLHSSTELILTQYVSSLRIVADFGDALAVNGDPNADPNVDGMTLLDGFGGQIPTTEEEVDVDNAIQHTADRTNLSPDDVYALIKESYGGDIGGQHYVSVSGEAHYYLPDSLVPQQPQEPQPQDPDQLRLAHSSLCPPSRPTFEPLPHS
jgi:hypothetical protein